MGSSDNEVYWYWGPETDFGICNPLPLHVPPRVCGVNPETGIQHQPNRGGSANSALLKQSHQGHVEYSMFWLTHFPPVHLHALHQLAPHTVCIQSNPLHYSSYICNLIKIQSSRVPVTKRQRLYHSMHSGLMQCFSIQFSSRGSVRFIPQ